MSKTFAVATELVIMQIFVLRHFNFCPTVWHFCKSCDTSKIEKVQYRALKYVFNDFPHCCILVEEKLFYWRCIKPTILKILGIYLKCLRNKEMSITLRTVKPLCSTNAILQRMGYIVFEGVRMLNKLDMSFRTTTTTATNNM